MGLAVLLFTEVKEWPEIGAQIDQKYDLYQFSLEIKRSQTVTEVFGKLREVIRDICNAMNLLRENLQHILIEQAIEYIVANYNKDISLQDVADQIHLSPTSFVLGNDILIYLISVIFLKKKKAPIFPTLS